MQGQTAQRGQSYQHSEDKEYLLKAEDHQMAVENVIAVKPRLSPISPHNGSVKIQPLADPVAIEAV
ncbi:MAG: hypothetical protein R3B74_00800 [Nitrospirales bacterium]|nr:hypothetical protein [Nitrospirales bacterium]